MTDPWIGRTFEGCRLEARIAASSSAHLYRASRGARGERVSVALVHPAPHRHLPEPQRILAVHGALAHRPHPSVATVHHAAIAEGQLVLVMAPLSGESLQHAVRRGPMAPGAVVQLAHELSSAVAHLHRLGLVHGHLSPHRVLLTPRGACLLELGVSDPMREKPPAADIAAIGYCLYMAATGRTGTQTTTPVAIAAPMVPPWLAELIDDCRSGDPSRRPADGTALEARVTTRLQPLRTRSIDPIGAMGSSDSAIFAAPTTRAPAPSIADPKVVRPAPLQPAPAEPPPTQFIAVPRPAAPSPSPSPPSVEPVARPAAPSPVPEVPAAAPPSAVPAPRPAAAPLAQPAPPAAPAPSPPPTTAPSAPSAAAPTPSAPPPAESTPSPPASRSGLAAALIGMAVGLVAILAVGGVFAGAWWFSRSDDGTASTTGTGHTGAPAAATDTAATTAPTVPESYALTVENTGGRAIHLSCSWTAPDGSTDTAGNGPGLEEAMVNGDTVEGEAVTSDARCAAQEPSSGDALWTWAAEGAPEDGLAWRVVIPQLAAPEPTPRNRRSRRPRAETPTPAPRPAPRPAPSPEEDVEPAATLRVVASSKRKRKKAGIEVRVDGRKRGNAPVSVPELPLGAHRVEATREGKRVACVVTLESAGLTVAVDPDKGLCQKR